jgi:hypothetical protein
MRSPLHAPAGTVSVPHSGHCWYSASISKPLNTQQRLVSVCVLKEVLTPSTPLLKRGVAYTRGSLKFCSLDGRTALLRIQLFFQWDRRELQLVVLALPFSLRKKWDRRGCRGTAWRCRYDWLRIVITLQGVE